MGLDMYLYQKEITDLGYWRKANAIHNWFVENVGDGVDECQEMEVTREQLQELLNLVNRVLRRPNLASKLLPTTSGFFFGGTEYDEYYFETLRNTKAILRSALGSNDEYFYYQASW